MPQQRHVHPEQVAATIPVTARRSGLGVRLLRELVTGEIQAYPVPRWPKRRLLFFDDVERNLRSRVVAPRGSRAEERVRERLEHERRKAE